MIKQVCLLIIIVILASCTLLKQRSEAERSTLHRINELSTINEKDSSSQTHLLMIRDSLLEDYNVEIIPTGMFSYSLKDGFKGMASSFKMNGSKSTQLLIKESKQVLALRDRTKIKTKEEVEQQTSKEVKRFKFNINFYIYIVVAVILVLFFYKVITRASRFH